VEQGVWGPFDYIPFNHRGTGGYGGWNPP